MQRNRKSRPSQRGFTLVEIMVVVVIIGLLAGIVGPAVLARLGEAEIDKAKADLSSIDSAVQTWLMRNPKVPTMEELVTPDSNGQAYLDGYTSEPLDPWKNPYQIIQLEGYRNFEVISWGADGIEGTEDDMSSKRKDGGQRQ